MRLAAGVFWIFASLASATLLQKVVVDGNSSSCLDGSPYAFYISTGSEPFRFVFYHQGGSWCFSQQECFQRGSDKSATSLGSSVGWPTELDMSAQFDRDSENNPLMANWTFVYLPYCDGGSFTGAASGTYNGSNLSYSGLANREKTVEALINSFNFAAATDVVVGGASAGGIAAYLHCDWYAAQVPSAHAACMPDSGFFEDGNNDRDGKGDYDANIKNLYGFMNSSAGIYSTACTAAIGYKCMFAYTLLPYIQTPVFALNSAYDATMGNGECGAGSGILMNWTDPSAVNACGNHVRAQMKTVLGGPRNAVFLDACRHHCGLWNAMHIDGMTCSAAMAAWYSGGPSILPNGGFMDAGNVYPCASCCADAE